MSEFVGSWSQVSKGNPAEHTGAAWTSGSHFDHTKQNTNVSQSQGLSASERMPHPRNHGQENSSGHSIWTGNSGIWGGSNRNQSSTQPPTWGKRPANTQNTDHPPTSSSSGPRMFNSAPGSKPIAPIGSSSWQQPTPAANSYPTPSSTPKVNPNNIWNIPTEPPNTAPPTPQPEHTRTIADHVPVVANSGPSPRDSFTNMGTWESNELKEKDCNEDPKGVKLWTSVLQHARQMEETQNVTKSLGGTRTFVRPYLPPKPLNELSDEDKRKFLDHVINSHEGWGRVAINQDTPWDSNNLLDVGSSSRDGDKDTGLSSSNSNSTTSLSNLPVSLSDPNTFPAMPKPEFPPSTATSGILAKPQHSPDWPTSGSSSQPPTTSSASIRHHATKQPISSQSTQMLTQTTTHAPTSKSSTLPLNSTTWGNTSTPENQSWASTEANSWGPSSESADWNEWNKKFNPSVGLKPRSGIISQQRPTQLPAGNVPRSGQSGNLEIYKQLELAQRAGLIQPGLVNPNMSTNQLVSLQQYAQQRFVLQKLRAQFRFLTNQMQNNKSNPHVSRQYTEMSLAIQKLESYLMNLQNNFQQISDKSIDKGMPSSANHHLPNQIDILNNPSAFQQNQSSINSQSRLLSWISSSGSSSGNGSVPNSASALEDNVFSSLDNTEDIKSEGFNKSGDLDFGPPEFTPGVPWKGVKDFENDPTVTPGSVQTTLSLSTAKDKDILNLTNNLAKLSTHTSDSSANKHSGWQDDMWNKQSARRHRGWGSQHPPSTWLVLKNLTTQIDGPTLRTLCLQHGPLINFHILLSQGIAFVQYSSKEEAMKAQSSLNACVLSNTSIIAEFATEAEMQSIVDDNTRSSLPTPAVVPPGGGSSAYSWNHQKHSNQQFSHQALNSATYQQLFAASAPPTQTNFSRPSNNASLWGNMPAPPPQSWQQLMSGAGNMQIHDSNQSLPDYFTSYSFDMNQSDRNQSDSFIQ